jgi:hypothetical protein
VLARNKQIKALSIAILLAQVSGCVEYACYSSVGHAVRLANKFCSQGNGSKELCKSLEIDGSVCGPEDTSANECLPLGSGIQTFIRIPYYECTELDEKVCRSNDACEWTFKDPIQMKFGDFIKTWP